MTPEKTGAECEFCPCLDYLRDYPFLKGLPLRCPREYLGTLQETPEPQSFCLRVSASFIPALPLRRPPYADLSWWPCSDKTYSYTFFDHWQEKRARSLVDLWRTPLYLKGMGGRGQGWRGNIHRLGCSRREGERIPHLRIPIESPGELGYEGTRASRLRIQKYLRKSKT